MGRKRNSDVMGAVERNEEEKEIALRQSKRRRSAPSRFDEEFDKLYSPVKQQLMIKEKEREKEEKEEDEEGDDDDEEKPKVRRSLRLSLKNRKEDEEEEEKKKGNKKGRKNENKVTQLLKGKGKGKGVNKAGAIKKAAPAPKKRKAPAKKRAPVRRRARGRAARRFRAFPIFNPWVPPPELPFVDYLAELIEEDEKREKTGMTWPSTTPDEKIPIENFEIHKPHVKFQVPLPHEELPLADVSAFELTAILKETEIPKEEYENWKSYGGANIFADKDAIQRALETVINYAENDNNASVGLKNKLRLITKILHQDLEARPGVLCLMASNGNLCNVQKEIGINMAYSMLTENMKEDMEKQSLKNIILRQLQTLRELIIEELFIATGNYMNSHPLVGFRNGLAPHLGLIHIPDQHTSTNRADKNRLQDFFKRYNVERIIKLLSVLINENPKKIGYEKMVDWFKENSPMDDSYEFLSQVYNEDGHVTQNALLFMLHKMEIIL